MPSARAPLLLPSPSSPNPLPAQTIPVSPSAGCPLISPVPRSSPQSQSRCHFVRSPSSALCIFIPTALLLPSRQSTKTTTTTATTTIRSLSLLSPHFVTSDADPAHRRLDCLARLTPADLIDSNIHRHKVNSTPTLPSRYIGRQLARQREHGLDIRWSILVPCPSE